MKVAENWGYMVAFLREDDQTSCGVLDTLEFLEVFAWEADEDTVTAVQTGCGKCVNKFSRGLLI